MTLRAWSSVVTFGVVAAAMALLLGDVLVRGSWEQALQVAGPIALAAWAAWLLLVRPSIRIRPDRAIVVNVGRVTEVPWARVVDIRRRLQLVFDLDDGRRVEAWGSPFPRRRMVGRTARTPEDDPGLTILRGAWMSGGSGPEPAPPVIRRVDVMALAIGAGAAVLAALSLAWGA